MKFWIYLSTLLALSTLSVQESIIEPLESNLAAHMIVEHTLFFMMGALSILVIEYVLKILVVRENKNKKTIINYGLTSSPFVLRLWIRLIRRIFTLNRYGILWIGVATGLVIFWHIPALFDFANENREIHVLQHISFIAIGATSLLAIRSLGENSTIFLLFSMAGMMAFTGLVFVILTERIYLFYNISEHNQAGIYMIISSIVLLLGVFPAYIIKRTLSFVKISD
jgi:cytochrome c oxidase assembly factor CtaG